MGYDVCILTYSGVLEVEGCIEVIVFKGFKKRKLICVVIPTNELILCPQDRVSVRQNVKRRSKE